MCRYRLPVVCISSVDWLERLNSEMTFYVWSGTLNSTYCVAVFMAYNLAMQAANNFFVHIMHCLT